MNKEVIGNATLYLGDCMEYMATLEDNAFDLAPVDPQYGIGFDGESKTMANYKTEKWTSAKGKNYKRKDWDKKPPGKEYFIELFRISKNQIIWGGNYFELPQSTGWIFWDKGVAESFTLSPGELAWTSFNKSVTKIHLLWSGFRKCEQVDRIHPTQKPVALYQWLLNNYAKPGQRIFDSHLGSASSAIAANRLNFEFTGIEIDKDYYEAACERVRQEDKQLNLFKPEVFEQTNFDLS